MKVRWSRKAKTSLLDVAKYIQTEFGTKAKTRFLAEVRKKEEILSNSPYVGVTDPLFYDRTVAYRSIIINGLSKMVYNVQGNTIRISAFWDTRREPKQQADQIE